MRRNEKNDSGGFFGIFYVKCEDLTALIYKIFVRLNGGKSYNGNKTNN